MRKPFFIPRHWKHNSILAIVKGGGIMQLAGLDIYSV